MLFVFLSFSSCLLWLAALVPSHSPLPICAWFKTHNVYWDCYRKGGDTNKMDKFLYPRMCVCMSVFVCACLYYIPLVTSGCVGQNIFNDFCKLRKFKQEAVKAFVGSLLRRRLPHSH
jgi:hypothetical protein